MRGGPPSAILVGSWRHLAAGTYEYEETEMPRRKHPKICACGCGKMTKDGEWFLGHNAEFLSQIVTDAGGTIALRAILDEHLAKRRNATTHI